MERMPAGWQLRLGAVQRFGLPRPVRGGRMERAALGGVDGSPCEVRRLHADAAPGLVSLTGVPDP
eukprot:3901865-Lingulodinium_polyedra.AAC.1